MSINTDTPSRFTTAQLARREGVDPATVFRWLSNGLLDRSGNRLRLAHEKRGGRIVIRAEAVDAFFAALTADPDERPPMVEPVSRTATDDDERRAEAMGL